MKTIEAWAVVRESGNMLVFTESEARRYAKECFGTAVKLTGQMPEKVKKTVWVNMYQVRDIIVAAGTYDTQAQAATNQEAFGAKYLGAHPITDVEVDE
jgi:hypothetical protein